jgi:hypothetical protein
MIKWLLKQFGYVPDVPAPAPQPQRPTGFFSTDTAFPGDDYRPDPDAIMELSIQAPPPVSCIAVAMDSANDITLTAVAMDSNIKATFNGGFGAVSELQASWYAAQGFIGYQMAAIIAQHWLVAKACSVPGEDAVRNWFKINYTASDDGLDTDKINTAFEEWDKVFNLRKNLEEFSNFNRVFGVRHALFVVQSDDPHYYEKPFNPDGVTRNSYKGISQIDPYWVTPELDADAAANPASKHFYEPTYYRISGKRYHRSHMIIIRNGDVADVLKPTYFYGGVPLPQKIYERVYASERVANEGPKLLMSKRLNVIHTDVEKALAKPQAFLQKMQQWLSFMDNFGVKVVGKDEVIEQFDTSLTDFDVTIMTQYQLVASIANVPATKLLGTSPKGFNATGEYDESSYHETLESIQTHDLSPLVERHYLLLMRSYVAHEHLGGKPLPVGITWNPTDAPTEKETAETNKLKAETGSALIASGAIDPAEERQRLNDDPDSGYNGLVMIYEPTTPPTNVAQETLGTTL